jgi:hypothetical protein
MFVGRREAYMHTIGSDGGLSDAGLRIEGRGGGKEMKVMRDGSGMSKGVRSSGFDICLCVSPVNEFDKLTP